MIIFVKKGFQQKSGDEKQTRVDLHLYLATGMSDSIVCIQWASGESQKGCKGGLFWSCFWKIVWGVFPKSRKNKLFHLLDVLDKKLGTEGLHENEEKYERSVSHVLLATVRI